MLPWGSVRSPGLAYWLTGPGDPDQWPVIAATEEGDYWDRFDGPVCEFLAEVAACRYDASGFRDLYKENGEDWIDLRTRPVFTPDPVVPVPGPGIVPPDSPMSGGAHWALRLAELVGVAANEHRSFDWAAIEGDLGVRLPGDYKRLAESFPAGWFRGWVRLWPPERTGGIVRDC